MDSSLSSPRLTKEAKLLEILSYYRPIEVLHSTVREMFESIAFKEHFNRILQHDLQLLRRRSQDLDDHEISLTQKAFVIIMEEEGQIPGIEIYVEEIIGLKVVEDKDKLQILKSSVKTRDLVVKKVQSGQSAHSLEPPSLQASAASRQARSPRHVSEELFISESSEHEGTREEQHPTVESEASEQRFHINRYGEIDVYKSPGEESDEEPKSPEIDPMFEKLWNVCKAAHKEYHKTALESFSRTKAAKFLRDTAENCIEFIERKQYVGTSQRFETSKLRALRNTLKETTEVATKGSGGRPRHFDEQAAPTAAAPESKGRTARELTVASTLTQMRGPVLPQGPNSIQLPPTRGYHGGNPYQMDRQRPTPPVRRPEAPRRSSLREEPRDRRRSASPPRRPDASRHTSQSEQSRDRRRQDPMPGYRADRYRPRY